MAKLITLEDLNTKQILGVEMFKRWKDSAKRVPFILAGYAGTGKTSMLSIAIVEAGYEMHEVLFMAPTGKASYVMRSKGMQANTIHSSIYDYTVDEATGETTQDLKPMDEFKVFGIKLFVVDEAGMTDWEIRRDIESFGVPVVYVGDNGQLDPVQGSAKNNIMNDPSILLDDIERNSGAIVEASVLFRTRKRVPFGVLGKGFKKVGTEFLETKKCMRVMCQADVVLCGYNKTRHKLNGKMREAKGFEGFFPEEGERMVCIKNNKEAQVFNGMTGICKGVKTMSDNYGFFVMKFLADGSDRVTEYKVSKEALYDDKAETKNKSYTYFQFGYALSVHKAQGSEFEKVLVVEEMLPKSMGSSQLKSHAKWCYTAITRASKSCLWVSRISEG